MSRVPRGSLPRRRDVLALALYLAASSRAHAQADYPDHPIKLVVPFTPGGVNDTIGRLWCDRMKAPLGASFIENMGGAGGMAGSAAVARSKPDGHTLLLGSTGPQVLAPLMTEHAPYDVTRDFAPITMIGLTSLAVLVNPAVPATTLPALVDYARAHPDKLSYGSTGVGTMAHVSGELFKSVTGLSDIIHVPYKGSGPLLGDLISGHVPLGMLSVTAQVLDLHRAGKLRVLVVMAERRTAAAPDIPTASEGGIPGLIAQNFYALLAPARTPDGVIDRIAAATRTAMADEAFRRTLAGAGVETDVEPGPDRARRFLQDEITRWSPLMKTIGLRVD